MTSPDGGAEPRKDTPREDASPRAAPFFSMPRPSPSIESFIGKARDGVPPLFSSTNPSAPVGNRSAGPPKFVKRQSRKQPSTSSKYKQSSAESSIPPVDLKPRTQQSAPPSMTESFSENRHDPRTSAANVPPCSSVCEQNIKEAARSGTTGLTQQIGGLFAKRPRKRRASSSSTLFASSPERPSKRQTVRRISDAAFENMTREQVDATIYEVWAQVMELRGEEMAIRLQLEAKITILDKAVALQKRFTRAASF